MSKFEVPEVDWAAVQFPIEGENNKGQKVVLYMVGPKSGDLFGEVLAGIWNRVNLAGQECWGSCIWYPDGQMHDVGQWTKDGDLKFNTFGKLPRKS